MGSERIGKRLLFGGRMRGSRTSWKRGGEDWRDRGRRVGPGGYACSRELLRVSLTSDVGSEFGTGLARHTTFKTWQVMLSLFQ